MQQVGFIRHIGLSEVGAATIRRAAAVAPISDLQIEYSLLSRGPESSIIPALRELGIGLTAYGVLSRGLLSGHWTPSWQLSAADFRAHSPRFQAENLVANLRLVDALSGSHNGWGPQQARLRSPGSPPKARTSSRSSARAAVTGSRSPSVPRLSLWTPARWLRSRRPCPPRPPRVSVTRPP